MTHEHPRSCGTSLSQRSTCTVCVYMYTCTFSFLSKSIRICVTFTLGLRTLLHHYVGFAIVTCTVISRAVG